MAKIVGYEVMIETKEQFHNLPPLEENGEEIGKQFTSSLERRLKIDTFELVDVDENRVIEIASALAPPEFVYYTIIGYYDSLEELHMKRIRTTIYINDDLEQEVVKKKYYRVPRPQRNEEFLAERRDSLGMNE